MKLVLQQIHNIKGNVRRPFLAQDAAVSLASLEADTDGLIYTEMWRDAVDSLLSRRMKGSSSVSYSPHNFGLAIDIDVPAILNQKKIKYEDLLWLMKRRGWYCFRRDGADNQTGSGNFNFLGDNADAYLSKSNQDPTSWQTVAEFKVWEKYGNDFQLDTKDVQAKLAKLGMYTGSFTGQCDLYTREAILAFQRAWDLAQTGSPDLTLCRAISFVTAEITFI